MKLLLHNATICNEGERYKGYLLIDGELIAKVGKGDPTMEIMSDKENMEMYDLKGKLLMPGVIDDQVHFRDPGFPEKGTIYSESRAAVAGGVTSYMEMPNTNPQTTTIELLESKFETAAKDSFANYSFYLGATNDNLDEIKKIDPKKVCGLKIFLGASTGNMLVDNPESIENIFKHSPVIVAAHCEKEELIAAKLAEAKEKYGDDIPPKAHPFIRSPRSCFASTEETVALAKKHGTRLHVLHLSTKRELDCFENVPLDQKKITCEVCVHHLLFSDEDYEEKGNLIKWNPAIKNVDDRYALRKGVSYGEVDVIGTDHAPHTFEEKQRPYLQAPSGAPFVQHSLPVMLELARKGVFTVERIVEMMCHNPANLFNVHKRGYLREGYYADLTVVNLDSPWTVSKDNILYKCGWSPIEGMKLSSKIINTYINGQKVYDNGVISEDIRGKRLEFDR